MFEVVACPLKRTVEKRSSAPEKEAEPMKASRLSEEQIIGILREVQAGGNTRAVCAAHNMCLQIR
jgi:hypothetical protein